VVHRNEFPNANYDPYRRLKGNRTLKQLIIDAGAPLPKNDRGHEMCLTFHLIGSCNSRCKCKRDHHDVEPGGKKHTAAEDTRLLAWCAQHITTE
jgi:hypothetical protein